MQNLEYVIRPYQSPTPFGTIIIPSVSSPGRDRATLTWGATAQGTMPIPEPTPPPPNQPSYQMECCKESLHEGSRANNTHRIIGSDGKSYIDVERPYQMKLKKQTKQDCGDDLNQISVVSQGVNAVLNDFQDAIDEITGKFGPTGDCHTEWNFSG
jgi:hypothetical protein